MNQKEWEELLKRKVWSWMPEDEINLDIDAEGNLTTEVVLSGVDEEHLKARYNEYMRRVQKQH